MASLKWYRWWPGAIPQLERVSPEIRGLAHALMDALWVNPSCIDEPAEMCRVLMLPCSTETAKVLNNLLPALEQFIDYERDDYNGHHDAKVEAGRKGGLARAERAKQTQAVLSSASSSQAHPSILPSIQPTDKKKEPTSRKRSVMPPKVKNPTEPNMEELYGVLAEVIQPMDGPDVVWDHARAKNAYWKIVGHWHPTKNPKPKQTLLAMIEATKAGTSIHQIYSGAEAYKEDNYNREHFMAQVSEWVKNEGWLPYVRRAG